MISMRGVKNKVFIDTNVLIYAYDLSAGDKHAIAKEVVLDIWNERRGVLSTQVLQEFTVAVTSKIARPIDFETVKIIISDFLLWDVVVNNGHSILEAVEIQSKHRLSFWDALIVQAARKGGAGVLLTEDLSDGRVIEGVRIKNPFKIDKKSY
jgi:predicted nucleic acid-binding protein